MKKISYILIALITAFSISAFVYKEQISTFINSKLKVHKQIEYSKKKPFDTFIEITKKDLEIDLSRYKNISKSLKKIYIDSIIEASQRYDINPLITYAIIATESSFRFHIKHPLVKVRVNKRLITTNAIGLGGVIYEIHKDDLIKEGIIETKEDLYLPEKNIMATAYIFSKYLKMPLKKGAKNKYQSAMMRYYGGAYKSYVKKIESQMGKIIMNKIYQ